MKHAASLFLSLLFAGGCSTPINVRTSHDPTADFSKLERFAWLRQTKTADDRVNDERLAKTVHQVVSEELATRGYVPAGSKPADFLVGYYAVLQRKSSLTTSGDAYSAGDESIWTEDYAPRMDPANDPAYYERVYDVGTLIIEIVHPKTKRLMWRGAANTEVNMKGPLKQRERQVRDAIRKMLDEFPP